MYTIEKCVLNKKWNINSAPNDASIPRMYVQDVPNNVPITNVPQTPPDINTDVVELQNVKKQSLTMATPTIADRIPLPLLFLKQVSNTATPATADRIPLPLLPALV